MLPSIIIANWKMNFNPKEEVKLSLALKEELGEKNKKEIVVCPSFIGLSQVSEVLKKSKIKLGAQDAFWQSKGAYTGEISPSVLKEIGCEYVIIGHSERRGCLGETDEMVNRKLAAVLANNLTPIICIGETLEEWHEGRTHYVVLNQLTKAFKNIHLIQDEQLVVAYEPVWAIGAGRPVEPEEAQLVFESIRQTLIDLYPLSFVNNNVRLIYGGSVDGKNAGGFSRLDLCSGFLVGGASLDSAEFIRIINYF